MPKNRTDDPEYATRLLALTRAIVEHAGYEPADAAGRAADLLARNWGRPNLGQYEAAVIAAGRKS